MELVSAIDLSLITGKTSELESWGGTDYWYPALDAGKCGAYVPDYAGIKDGSDRLTYEVYHNISHPDCECGASFGVNVTELAFYDFVPSGASFVEFSYMTDDCIDPTSYSNATTQILNRIVDYRPTGKFEKNVDVFGDFVIFDGFPEAGAFRVGVKYANVICNEDCPD